MAKQTPTQRVDAYIKKQERREEALDLINKIAALQNQVPNISTKNEPKKKESEEGLN